VFKIDSGSSINDKEIGDIPSQAMFIDCRLVVKQFLERGGVPI